MLSGREAEGCCDKITRVELDLVAEKCGGKGVLVLTSKFLKDNDGLLGRSVLGVDVDWVGLRNKGAFL